MAKGQLKDFLAATWEECGKALLDSDITSDAIAEIGGLVVEESTALTIGSVVSAIAPKLNGIRITYQQKRFERNIKQALAVFNSKISQIDERLNALDQYVEERFRGIYVEWFLDNLYSEKQTEKVQYHVNSYINMMDDSTTDDLMLLFMETLNQLTCLDIDVLKLYSIDSEENCYDLIKRHGISGEQYLMIQQKLERNGLLYSRNEDQRDANIDILVDYIEKRTKEEAKKNGDIKKVKLGRTKRVNKSESYSITKLGCDFLDKIEG